MRKLLPLLVLSSWPCMCLAQEATSGPLAVNALADQAPAEQSLGPKTITIPEGTRVQVALANPIHTRSARAGDIVRATTTFPVTVGQDLAIPQGTFLEGIIVKVGKRGSTRFNGLQIRFNRLVFNNGYEAGLEAIVAENSTLTSQNDGKAVTEASELPGNSLQQGPTPMPPPPPQAGPSKGPIIGAAVGGVAAAVVLGILFGRHRIQEQPSDFDTGFQFEVVLQAPLTIDGAGVAAAVGAAKAQ